MRLFFYPSFPSYFLKESEEKSLNYLTLQMKRSRMHLTQKRKNLIATEKSRLNATQLEKTTEESDIR